MGGFRGRAGEGPLVSVIVPSYNHARFLQESVASLVAQSYPRIELILIDDGSTDGSIAVAEAMAADCRRRFVRFVLLRQENRGLSATLNRGLAVAEGVFVCSLASDDRALPEKIAALLEHPAWRDPAVAMVFGDAAFIDAEGRPAYVDRRGRPTGRPAAAFGRYLDYFRSRRPALADPARLGSYESLLGGNPIPAPSVLLRRAAVLEAGGYDEDLLTNDWSLWLRLARRHRLVFLDRVVACYRRHARNTIRTQRRRLRRETIQILLRERGPAQALGCGPAWRAAMARQARSAPALWLGCVLPVLRPAAGRRAALLPGLPR